MELAQMDSMGIFQPRFVHIRRQNLLYDSYNNLHKLGNGLDCRVRYDGYDSLHKLGDGLKGRVRVQFIDEHGEPEAGVVSASLKYFAYATVATAFCSVGVHLNSER
eukprot:1137796-Pelagomonas_calceolata.AAC.3